MLSGTIFAQTVGQNRSAHTCSLILLCTLSCSIFGFCQRKCIHAVEPFPKRQILDSPKLKGLADNNFKFDEDGRKFSKRVENTVGKGEIVRYEQFLLFPQCFQKTCTGDT